MNSVVIILYRWAGKKFGITIKSECEECEINYEILKDMKQKEFKGKPVAIEVRPWLTCLWETLRRGGWHAPVIIVNGRLFSQGSILDRNKLAQLVFTLIGDEQY